MKCRVKWLPLALLLAVVSLHIAGLSADPAAYPVVDPERARVNYMLHCQGCHLPDATGTPGKVPGMKDFVGNFLHSPEGRAYVIRVPGVATAQLTDSDVAELMNWLLTTYSAEQLPESFEPFTGEEVAGLRKDPDGDPAASRQRILDSMAATLTPESGNRAH